MRRFAKESLATSITFLIGTGIVFTVHVLFGPIRSYKPLSPPTNANSLLKSSFVKQAPPIKSSVTEQTPLKRQKQESVSPHEIKRFIDEQEGADSISLTEYWNRLGIEEAEQYSKYKAQIFKLQLDSEPGNEVLLRVFNENPPVVEARYLIFKPASSTKKTSWRFLGYVDAAGYFGIPNYEVIIVGNHHWLVLTYGASHGSAYGLAYDEWYEIGNDGVKKVLSYSSGKYVGFHPPILETKAHILSVKVSSNMATVKIQFSASYSAYNPEETRVDTQFILWNKKQVATFVKRLDSDEGFSLDSLKSNVSAEELETVYDGDSVGAEDVIKYNYTELAKIAAGKQTKRKEWLRHFLDKSRDTQEKGELRRKLEQ